MKLLDQPATLKWSEMEQTPRQQPMHPKQLTKDFDVARDAVVFAMEKLDVLVRASAMIYIGEIPFHPADIERAYAGIKVA